MTTRKKKTKAQIEAQRAQASAAGKLGGRPMGSTLLEGLPVWFSSLQQMSSMIGIRKEVLIDAKKQGWPCFRSNRIHLQEFLKQYFREQDQLRLPLGDGTEVKSAVPIVGKDMKEHYAGLREKARYEREVLGTLVEKGVIRDGLLVCQNELFSLLDRRFLSELPPALQGLAAAAIRDRMTAEIAELKSAWRAQMKAMEEAGSAPDPEEDGESASAGSEE